MNTQKGVIMIKKIMSLAVLMEVSLLAHTGAGIPSGFISGFLHPVGGTDHILAMFAVGIWAAQMGGRALWAVPVSFVSMMIVGAILGVQGIHIPFIEEGILVSIIVLGAFIVLGIKLPILLSSLIAGAFAMFHGHAHAAEMPLNTSGFEYGIGFVLATGIIHILGIAVAVGIRKISHLKTIKNEYA